MRENAVENHLIKKAKQNQYLCYKFLAGGNSGVPDRILIGHGNVIFVETKAPGKIPRKKQVEVHRQMRKHGATVYVLDTVEKVDAFFEKE